MTNPKFSHLLFELLKYKFNSETLNIHNGTPDGVHLRFLIILCVFVSDGNPVKESWEICEKVHLPLEMVKMVLVEFHNIATWMLFFSSYFHKWEWWWVRSNDPLAVRCMRRCKHHPSWLHRLSYSSCPHQWPVREGQHMMEMTKVIGNNLLLPSSASCTFFFLFIYFLYTSTLNSHLTKCMAEKSPGMFLCFGFAFGVFRFQLTKGVN